MAAAGTVRLRALLARRGRGGGGAQPGLPGVGGGGHPVVTPGNETDFDRIEGDLDAAMRSGRLRHDGDPVLRWCVGNVVGRPDRRGNLYPAKQRPEQKIDAAVALMMAVRRAMAEDASQGDLEDFLRNSVIA